MNKWLLIPSVLVASLALQQGVYADSTSDQFENFKSEADVSNAYGDERVSNQRPTGRYFVLSQVAFQGSADKRFGWPVNAGSFEKAVNLARQNGIAAFHYYVDGDSAAGYMFPFYSVNGYEAREGVRQAVGVIMEQSTIH